MSKVWPQKLDWLRIHNCVLIFFVGVLSVTVLLKVAEIQYLELLLAADFIILLGIFMTGGWRFSLIHPYFSVAKSYGLFMGIALVMGVVALRQDFFLVDDSFLKRPLLLTVARLAELFLDIFYVLYLASVYREDKYLCRYGALTYYWAGIAGCIYSLVSFPLNLMFDLDLGAYGEAHRLRGFDNEAGPYGTYLISVGLLVLAMYHRNWLSKTQFRLSMPLIVVCLVGSQSKAAFFAAALIGTILATQALEGWKRWSLIVGMCVAVVVTGLLLGFQEQINVYIRGAEKYNQLSKLRADDLNVVMGRVAGSVLAPRMIAAHPWTGIGWGNYPLVRDDPQYRQGSAFARGSTDSPSLGAIDYIVDLGFPLWFYMTWISLKPAYLLRRKGADIWVIGLAFVQPVSNWFGAHLNITYPWVILALALGMGFGKSEIKVPRNRIITQELSGNPQ